MRPDESFKSATEGPRFLLQARDYPTGIFINKWGETTATRQTAATFDSIQQVVEFVRTNDIRLKVQVMTITTKLVPLEVLAAL